MLTQSTWSRTFSQKHALQTSNLGLASLLSSLAPPPHSVGSSVGGEVHPVTLAYRRWGLTVYIHSLLDTLHLAPTYTDIFMEFFSCLCGEVPVTT
jgi:hypothetical protein